MKTIHVILTGLVVAIGACVTSDQSSKAPTSRFLTPDVLCGTVQFNDGCGESTDSLISFGLALVHHMTFEDAEHIFDQVITSDPDCFWGHWGKALSYIHPLWPDVPSETRMSKGWILSQRALSLAQKPRETHFGEALAAYYRDGQMKTEKERLAAYKRGWEVAVEADPQDLEARLFHGLCRLALVPPDDKSYKVQLEVGQMAEQVLEEIPDHPGGFHYAIHAYDFPPLAHHAVRVARNYGKIAPEIPHALHMPTHIFTRLGYWQESIDWNIRSARAAARLPVQGQTSLHFLHALDYMVYGYLQQGEDQKAVEVLEGLDTLDGPIQSHAATAYALASIPARYAMERKNWVQAASIPTRTPSHFPWDKFPAFEAITYFAKGVGSANIGDTLAAKKAYYMLDSLQESMGTSKSTWYWRQQIEIQKLAVEGWIAKAKNQIEVARTKMQAAVDIEDSLDKNPITPGEILPANEMMGDLLMSLDKPSEALSYYVKSLKGSPNRLNSIYMGILAATNIGDMTALTKLKDAWDQLIAERQDSERASKMRENINKIIS